MKVQPQTIPTPRGCLVGWKAVTKGRYPVYRRCHRSPKDKYAPGTVHIADSDGRPGFGEYQSAKGLAEIRSAIGRDCMPGIHLFAAPAAAKHWLRVGSEHHPKVIPVAYSPKSIVGEKDKRIIVVYRIQVLG